MGSETRKTRRNARVQVHVLLGRERVFALLLLEDAAELHDALLLVRERGGGQIALARGLRRIRVGLRSRGKRARSAARRREPREYRRVPRGRACMKSHPSSRLMTLRSFIIPDARASRSRCVDQELALSPSRYEISGSDAVTSSLDTLCRVSRVRRTTGTPSTRVVRRTSEPRQLARCFTVAPGGRARPRTRLAKTHVTRTRALGFRAKAQRAIGIRPHRLDETADRVFFSACLTQELSRE